MCGVAGFIDPQSHVNQPRAVLRRMMTRLRHRGPDDHGTVSSGPAHFAHTRLSILDLSPQGRQPFDVRTPEGRFIALANGELYNHAALRTQILSRYPQASIAPSDCAVLPWLAADDLDEVPAKLDGMFAVALWDDTRQRLLLARDPAGQKPLYYASTPGGGLVFGSELKSVLTHPHVKRDLDPLSMRQFLAFDFVPMERSIYTGVKKLRPGERLIWQRGHYEVQRFAMAPPNRPMIDAGEAAHTALWEALVASVGSRLMADVPLGVFLSGGLDSAAVVAALGEHRELSTFSIGFEDRSFDESLPARQVAAHFGTKHHEEQLTASAMLELIPKIMALADEPFADPSVVPTYLLAQFARQHITVALSGDGGDEHLWGYPTFYAEGWASKAARIPRVIRHPLSRLLTRLVPDGFGHMSLGFKLRRFLSGLDHEPLARHVSWVGGVPVGVHPDALREGLVTDHDAVLTGLHALAEEVERARPGASQLESLAWQYERTYLADGVLTKVDRASMTHGLEVRAPFLDRRVRGVCARLVPEAKLQGRRTKVALRNVLKARVPPAIVEAPKKGFGIPVARWLRGPLQGWMRDILRRSSVAEGGVLNPDWTDRLIREHVSGRVNHRKALWSAICFELWRKGPHGPHGD